MIGLYLCRTIRDSSKSYSHRILLGTHLESSGIKYLFDVMTKLDNFNKVKYNYETNAKPS